MKTNLITKSLRGFTLIEMLVVIAIISILAGVVLTGVAGFQASARDTARITDLKQVQIYLETYQQRFNHYPGDDTGAVAAASKWGPVATSGTLSEVLSKSLNTSIPNDPLTSGGRTFFYGTDTENLQYVIGAKLEKDNNALHGTQVLHALPTGVTMGGAAMDCTDPLDYCISS